MQKSQKSRMNTKRPFVLSIAGFDPCGGAGLLADIKAMEQLQCYGLGVQTSNTIQNEREVRACYWTPKQLIKEQIAVLFDQYSIEYVKIGIIENGNRLAEIIHDLKKRNPAIQIILDPVLSASSGFEFQKNNASQRLLMEEILTNITLITPNHEELLQLFGKSKEESIALISNKTHLLLKGGHSEEEKGTDYLYTKEKKTFKFIPRTVKSYEKHGSGCVLSAAITAYLAKGKTLPEACRKAKEYTEGFLNSNKSLLGYHSR